MAVYCSADWHGNYWVWEQVKEILKPDDKLFFLGDANDRGPDGWKIIKEILKDGRIIYIKGNHEKFIVDALGRLKPEDFKPDNLDWIWNRKFDIWFYNGGRTTYENIIEDNISPEEKIKIINKLNELPFCVVYHNGCGDDILLSHAGCDNFEAGNIADEDTLLWDRNHCMFYDTWWGNDTEIIVHGHTPIPYLYQEHWDNYKTFKKYESLEPNYDGGAYWYGKGHKVDIDMGTIFTNQAVLLNLQNWEETILSI